MARITHTFPDDDDPIFDSFFITVGPLEPIKSSLANRYANDPVVLLR